MKPLGRTAFAASLGILVLLCVVFSVQFLQGGPRSGFLLSYLVLIAWTGYLLAAALGRWQTSLLLGFTLGLVGPAVGVALVVAFEFGAVEPGGSPYERLTHLMAVLWLPGNWLSSIVGMETRLGDLDISRSAEILEWIRLIPFNSLVYTLLVGGTGFLLKNEAVRTEK